LLRVWLCLGTAVFALAACDARAPGRQVIIDRCLADGAGGEDYCVCLARESDDRLDDEMFELVARAASGDAETAEEILAIFEPAEQITYSTLLAEVVRACDSSRVPVN
jgi:hypothetical protein